MEMAVWIVLALVVAVVAIDAIARLDERRKPRIKPKDESLISTQKIVVDLSNRRGLK